MSIYLIRDLMCQHSPLLVFMPVQVRLGYSRVCHCVKYMFLFRKFDVPGGYAHDKREMTSPFGRGPPTSILTISTHPEKSTRD